MPGVRLEECLRPGMGRADAASASSEGDFARGAPGVDIKPNLPEPDG